MNAAFKSITAATLATLGTLAFAHDTPAEGRKVEERKIIVIKHGDGPPAHATHAADHQAVVAGCDGRADVDVTDETSEADGKKIKKSRVVICSHDKVASADIVKRLQDAREQIARQQELSEQTKAKALAAIDAAIARHSDTKRP